MVFNSVQGTEENLPGFELIPGINVVIGENTNLSKIGANITFHGIELRKKII
jgi:hypothetical protein